MLSDLTSWTERRRRALIGVVLAVCSAMIIATALAPKAKAAVVCNAEASVGLGVSDTTVKDGSDKIDLAGVGALGGLGGGCDLQDKSTVVGVLMRASLMDLKGETGDAKIKSDQLYEAAFRAGVRVHEKYTVYGLAGWAWSKLSLPDGLGVKNPEGLMLGGGVDFHVTRNVYARSEYTWHDFSSQKIGGGAKIEPDLHIFRVGAVIKFNDPAKYGPSIFDDSLDVAPPAPCDPKLANCKKVKP